MGPKIIDQIRLDLEGRQRWNRLEKLQRLRRQVTRNASYDISSIV